jgi:diaminohydroxyphosphoribosylaminopyrimidine deaminase / 5-amino-6-(5-phosphoribosylamino)uracil reductase
MTVLCQAKLTSLIIEGGARLLQSFIDADLWDEARIFTGSALLGDGVTAPKIKSAHPPAADIAGDMLRTYTNHWVGELGARAR